MECFAFGGATVRFALCVIGNEFPCRQPHNPSATLYEGLPLCTKDKNRSPFHGEKLLMIK
ncbi:MAG: hypothetical protein SPJ60_06180 [Sodaliphilus sp.]|nr:hypothetical protein [Sodaliphilus sp.]